MVGQKHRFEALDSLRGVCACMIVLLHLKTFGHISRSVFVDHAFLFVDFFFVLSGFVIAASYGERLGGGFPAWKFMALRLGRIYPLHAAMLAVLVAFELISATGVLGRVGRPPFSGSYDLSSLAASALLVQIFAGADATYWNAPSWSIAAEMWTYALAALFFRYVPRARIAILLAVAAVCVAVLLVVTDRYINVFHDGALFRCILGFALGVVAWLGHRRSDRLMPRSRSAATAIEALLVVAVVAAVTWAGASAWSLAVPPLFLLVVAVFAHERGAVSALLRRRPFRFVGMLSYSIYMIHWFVELRLVNALSLVERLSAHRLDLVVNREGSTHIGGSPLFGDVMSLVGLGIVVALAYLSYRWIELPGQRWSRALVLGERPRRPALSAEREAPTF